jgi:hypothetical protein
VLILQPAGSEQIFWWRTQSIWTVGEGWPRKRRCRRQLAAVDAAHAALRMRQEELDILLAAPATDWVEAVAKARYLLILFAQSPAAEDPRRATLIAMFSPTSSGCLQNRNTTTKSFHKSLIYPTFANLRCIMRASRFSFSVSQRRSVSGAECHPEEG